MIRARKRFGQHFLEGPWVDKLVRVIDPQSDQTFIEIGPGRGALTRPLAARAKAVVVYEIDRDLARDLRAAALPNVTVVEGDFLDHFPTGPNAISAFAAQSPVTDVSNPQRPLTGPTNHQSPNHHCTNHHPTSPQSPIPNHYVWRVAGNLPYNVASPIMFRLVDAFLAGVPIVDATLMLQLEVAERLVAPPGTKEYGVLSVLIGHCAKVDVEMKLPPGAFRPPPKVRSAVVRLQFHPPEPPVRDRRTFERLVKAVFTHRRKTLANALRGLTPGPTPRQTQGLTPGQTRGLSPDLSLGDRLLDLRRRPETLSIAEFAALADVFSSA